MRAAWKGRLTDREDERQVPQVTHVPPLVAKRRESRFLPPLRIELTQLAGQSAVDDPLQVVAARTRSVRELLRQPGDGQRRHRERDQRPLALELHPQRRGEVVRPEARRQNPAQEIGAPGQQIPSTLLLHPGARVDAIAKKPCTLDRHEKQQTDKDAPQHFPPSPGPSLHVRRFDVH